MEYISTSANLPYLDPVEDVGETPELPEGAVVINPEKTWKYSVDLTYHVPYCMHSGKILYMDIYKPVPYEPSETETDPAGYPLIIFVQGSGWLENNITFSITQHIAMCEKGYVVAVPEYRSSLIAPFPGHMEDIKTAVRFLKKNASTYNFNPERIALWGCSSGGHVALMSGITGDDDACGSEYPEYSSTVNAIVDWYGPTDIAYMACWPSAMDHLAADSPEGMMVGGINIGENPQAAYYADPILRLSEDKPTPPILIMHGGSDEKVPFHQSVQLYDRLKELGKTAEFVKITGAGHGTRGFRSNMTLDIVDNFIRKTI